MRSGLCDVVPTSPLCGAINAAQGAGDAVAGSVLDSAAAKLVEGFASSAQMVVTFWTGVGVPGLTVGSGPIGELRDNTAWLTAFIAVVSVLVCAGRMAISRSSRPAGELFDTFPAGSGDRSSGPGEIGRGRRAQMAAEVSGQV